MFKWFIWFCALAKKRHRIKYAERRNGWNGVCCAPCLCSYSGFSTSHPAPVPKALSQNSDIYFVNRWKKRHDKKKCAHIVHRTNINIFNTYSERTVRSLKHNSQMFKWTLMPKNSCDDTKDVLIQFINIFFSLLLCSWHIRCVLVEMGVLCCHLLKFGRLVCPTDSNCVFVAPKLNTVCVLAFYKFNSFST